MRARTRHELENVGRELGRELYTRSVTVVFGVFVVFHVFSMCLFELVGFVSSFGVAIGLFALIYPVVKD